MSKSALSSKNLSMKNNSVLRQWTISCASKWVPLQNLRRTDKQRFMHLMENSVKIKTKQFFIYSILLNDLQNFRWGGLIKILEILKLTVFGTVETYASEFEIDKLHLKIYDSTVCSCVCLFTVELRKLTSRLAVHEYDGKPLGAERRFRPKDAPKGPAFACVWVKTVRSIRFGCISLNTTQSIRADKMPQELCSNRNNYLDNSRRWYTYHV